jgi:hypothetical protein
MRQCAQISPGLYGIRGILLKCGLLPRFSQHPLVLPEGIRHLPFDDFPIEARLDLQPAIDAAIAAGLRWQFCYRTLPDNEFNPADVTRAIAFLSEDHRFWGVLAWARIERAPVVRKLSAFQCRSLLTTGDALSTTNRRPTFDPPAHLSIARIVGGSPQAIVDLHLRRLQEVAADQIVRVTEEQLGSLLLRQSQELVNELLRRGLLRAVEDRR